ncbi:MAG: YeeE/YedE family protein [Gammaproteobacteria bacterium]|nr:YeeE/YedE family protein [Gammaproteobacteria bacterium]
MELSIHNQILLIVFITAAVMGAIVNKTNFCTMGAVSDWVNMGDMGRIRAWLLAMAIGIAGVLVMETAGVITLPGDTFPPYRTASFAWLRYVLGGFIFGIGMTLGSGCGNKTLVRIGGGNIKSIFVLAIMGVCAYVMLWTNFFDTAFMSWIRPTIVDLTTMNMPSQKLGDMVGAGSDASGTIHLVVGALAIAGILFYVFKSAHFRGSFDHILGGVAVGVAVLIGWYVTGSNFEAWKEFADFSETPPSRVAVQSYTFISPAGDLMRYLQQPGNLGLINFGVVALLGVIAGSFLYAIFSKSFRIEWFVNRSDFINHAVGGVLMGIGGVLSMGCTIGQAVTGVSTLALGSFVTFAAIVFGCALTMKVQFNLLDEQGFGSAVVSALREMKLLPQK